MVLHFYAQVIDAYAEILCAKQSIVDDFTAMYEDFFENPLSGRSYCFPTIWQVKQHIILVLQKVCKMIHFVTVVNFEQFFQFSSNECTSDMRNEMIDNCLEDALKNRFIHFPIQLDDHWTVVIFDTKGGEWLHYNSMKPVDDSVDPHFTVAKRLVKTTSFNYYTSNYLFICVF